MIESCLEGLCSMWAAKAVPVVLDFPLLWELVFVVSRFDL